MDTTTIAPLTTTSLLAARGWSTGHTEHLEGDTPGEWTERTFYVLSDADAAALRELMGQLPDAPAIVFWEIAHRADPQTGDFTNVVQLVAQSGAEQAHYGVDRCPSHGLSELCSDLEMFGAPEAA